MMFANLGLPEVPGSNETFTSGLEMLLDLIEDKKLFFAVCQVMNDSDTEDVVEVGESLPNIRLGNVCL